MQSIARELHKFNYKMEYLVILCDIYIEDNFMKRSTNLKNKIHLKLT